jgi:3-deoxy-D-manno-octulosonate 8-phosphate phosphatase KdsC-like HAD superfamily phosphatase
MTKDEALKLALDWYDSGHEGREEFQAMIENLLAAPVQEPVAVIGSDFQLLYCREDWAKGLKVGDTLCLCTPPAAQRQWVGLMQGVRVEREYVVVSVHGGNGAARKLCEALIQEMNT